MITRTTFIKIFLIGAVLALSAYWIWSKDILSLLSEGSLQQVITFIRSWGIAAPLLSIALMVFQAILAPIPAFLITGANGVIFGVFWGSFISWIGAMVGALVAFYLAKWFGEPFIEKFMKDKKWYVTIDRLIKKYGFKTILISRLIPLVSFDGISFAAGLSGMKLRTFLLATGVGMVPGTIAYALLGHDLVRINEFQNRFIIISLSIIAVVLIGYILKRKMSAKY